jgi:hypothetical protein
MQGLQGAPAAVLHEMDIMIQVRVVEFQSGVFRHVQGYDPAAFIPDVLPPFFIIAIVRAMEVQDVFGDEDEFMDPFGDQTVDHLALQGHDIIFDTVIPFPDHFNDGKRELIIGVKDFDVEIIRSKIIPLWVDEIIIDGIGISKLIILPPIKWGLLILLGCV